MQQANDYATQQTIIYKLMESSTGLQKQHYNQPGKDNQWLQKNLYLNDLIGQVQSLGQFQTNCRKLQQLINKVQKKYSQLKMQSDTKSQRLLQLSQSQAQAKNKQIQMKALSFQSSKKYDYKIRLKQDNENKRKQLELILIEENRLKDQILIRSKIKVESTNLLNQVKNQFQKLSSFNQQLVIQQIQCEQQVNDNLNVLNSKIEQLNEMKRQKQKLQFILQAAKRDNSKLQTDIQTMKTIKLQKKNRLLELKDAKSNLLSGKQNALRQKSICQMNFKQMRLNCQSIMQHNGESLKAKFQDLQKKNMQFQAENIQIQNNKIVLQKNISQMDGLNIVRKQQLLDNFRYIQMYQQLNQQLIQQIKALIPFSASQELQSAYFQRAKLYWKQSTQFQKIRNRDLRQRLVLRY